MIEITQFQTYRSIRKPDPLCLPLEELFALLTTHITVDAKEDVKLFAPAVFQRVDKDGCKHAREDGGAVHAHRCDASVKYITALAFDADQGTEDDVRAAHRALIGANISHVFYSTFSYDPSNPGRAPYRLVVLINRPIMPAEFKGVRLNVIKAFGIPCDAGSSAGVSHSYYWPSRRPGGVCSVLVHSGNVLDVDSYLGEDEEVTKAALYTERSGLNQAALEVLRQECAASSNLLIQRMLDGKPIGTEGNRHGTVMSLRAKLCGLFTDVDPNLLCELAREALEATNEGERDFCEEFLEGLEDYQGQLFAQDEAAIAKLRPVDFPPFPVLDAFAQAAGVDHVRAVLGTRVKDYRDRGEMAKASTAKAVARQEPLSRAATNQAVWMMVAFTPDYPPSVYVDVLRTCLVGSSIGPDRARQLVTESLYKQHAAKKSEDDFARKMEARRGR